MKQRVGWRVDGKWIAGIFFTVSLFVLTIFLNLYQLTSFEQAKNITELMFKEPVNQLIDTNYSLIMTSAQLNPEQALELPQEIPFRVEIKGKDIINKTPEELKEYITDQIATQMYNDGLQLDTSEVESSTQGLTQGSPQEQQMPSLNINPVIFGMMSLFTARSNRLFGTLLVIPAIFTLLFFGLIVGFSYRFGKAVSPGICFTFVGFWGTLLSSPARLGMTFFPDEQYSDIFGELSTTIFTTYTILMIIGIILVLIGLVGGAIVWLTYGRNFEAAP